jgi:hypothetical protein
MLHVHIQGKTLESDFSLRPISCAELHALQTDTPSIVLAGLLLG